MKYKTLKLREKDYEKLREMAEQYGLTIQDLISRLTRDMVVLPNDCRPWSHDTIYCYDSRHKLWTPCLRFGKLYCYDIEKGTYVPFSES